MEQGLALSTGIPLSAAWRDDVFFFGTLMHPDVLARVVDRAVPAEDLVPARLQGFRRVRAREASYPLLIETPNACVHGRLLRRPTRRDLLRINHFEDEEYEARLMKLAGSGQAWVFLGLDALRPTDEPWDLDAWARAHMPSYLASVVDYWMASAPA